MTAKYGWQLITTAINKMRLRDNTTKGGAMRRSSGGMSGSGSGWGGEPMSIMQFLHLCLTFVLFVSTVYMYMHVCDDHDEAVESVSTQLLREELSTARADLADVQKRSQATCDDRILTEVRSVRSDMSAQCQNQLKALQDKNTNTGGNTDVHVGKVKAEAMHRESALRKQLALLHESTKKMCTSLIRHEFGSASSFLVEIKLAFPASMGTPDEETILIESAPVEKIPTGVYYFLKQVDLGLWNGCSFFRNAQHVLQATSRSADGKSEAARFQRVPALTESVPYQEFDDSFPHIQYTLGLAGRPGGPDFYISTIDNTQAHGPGGQGGYVIKEEADVAFAKLAARDHDNSVRVVKRMQTAAKLPGNFNEMKEYIGIKSMRILK